MDTTALTTMFLGTALWYLLTNKLTLPTIRAVPDLVTRNTTTLIFGRLLAADPQLHDLTLSLTWVILPNWSILLPGSVRTITLLNLLGARPCLVHPTTHLNDEFESLLNEFAVDLTPRLERMFTILEGMRRRRVTVVGPNYTCTSHRLESSIMSFMFPTCPSRGLTPTPEQPVRNPPLQLSLGAVRRLTIPTTSPRSPTIDIFTWAILVGSDFAVRVIWPRIHMVVTLVLTFRSKQITTLIPLEPAVTEATQLTPLILPTVLLRGVTMDPRIALVDVFGQVATITIAGGVTLGNRLTGRAPTSTSLIRITMTETIVERMGCLTNASNPTLGFFTRARPFDCCGQA